ncbi:MAG: 3-methyl-2-oxobutanoate dehydrogenase subunit beta, partial [Duncaniella sp.]|nr:3-methyl-2-oxobutanoate dehydrogenase subunit beta [Duncaniella sp.]
LPPFRPRRTDEEIAEQCPWAVTGRRNGRKPNVMTTLVLDPQKMEVNNLRLQDTYRRIAENEVRFEEFMTDDAEWLIVAFGSVARICQKAIEEAREKGVKVGLLRPITLWPFPTEEIARLSRQVKGMLVVELNAGQMIEDVRLSLDTRVPVRHFGRMGGIVMDPDEVTNALNSLINDTLSAK